MDPAPVWLERNANRSLRSGAAIAALMQENLEHGEVVTLLHLARSGSDIEAGLFGPRTKEGKKIDGWIGNIGQLDELKRTVGERRIDALILSIGVNDVGFTGSLENLVKKDLGWGNDTENREAVMKKIDEKIAGLDTNFQRLASALARLNIGQVYITEYPTAIFDKTINDRIVVSGGCEIFSSDFDMDITLRDAQDLREAAGKLNRKLNAMAKRHGWVYISGIADKFSGHGYCMGRDSYFVTAEVSLVTQGDTEGTMHPNGHGHGHISFEIARELRARLPDSRVQVQIPGPVITSPLTGPILQNPQKKP